MLTVYDYLNPSHYLRDSWQEKRLKNPSFTLRSWAQKMGWKAHNPLYEILNGKRSIPKKYVPSFIQSLNLGAKEGLYFETLVDLQKAKRVDEKEFYLNQLKSLSPKKEIQFIEVDTYKYLSHPLHGLIIEMTSLKGFEPEPFWIKSRISFKTTHREINDALKRLLQLGFIFQDEDGQWQRKHANLSTRPDVKDLAVQVFHKKMSFLASEQITNLSLDEREFDAYILNIKKEKMADAKRKLRGFAKDFISEFEANPGSAENSYAINLQLFKLTNNTEK